jgi:hypothetical protein
LVWPALGASKAGSARSAARGSFRHFGRVFVHRTISVAKTGGSRL